MVRAGSRAPSTGRAPSVNRMRKNRDKPYKVQIESVMTKKKKLKLHDIHGSAKPLPGYTYLPVGFSDLAEECKELSRRKDADVAVVSAGSRTAANDPSKLSHHIYRVGYHFRTDIFDQACNKLGYCERNGKLEKITGLEQPTRFEKTMSRYGSRFDLIDINNRSEEESNKVKKHIRELFPKIPEVDLQEIYERAWEQGARTVGNADDLSLSRQVQLATIARIRHTYTDYDHLLRVGTWKDARTAVEHKCLAKLIEWRGEHDNDDEELEEILRETIVIDDESDDDDAEYGQNTDDSDSSLEIVQHTIAPKDLRLGSSERNTIRSSVPPRKCMQTRMLPAAIQARWQNARSERYGTQVSKPDRTQGERITVALDNQGQAPRMFESGGLRFVRLSPAPETPPRHAGQRGSPITRIRDDTIKPDHGYGDRYSHQGLHNRPYDSHHRMENREPLAMQYAHPRPDYHSAAVDTAVQSIENVHEVTSTRASRPAYHGAVPFVDLTTPPKSGLQGGLVNPGNTSIAFDGYSRPEASWDHARRGEDAHFMYAQSHLQAPPRAITQSQPALPSHHSGMDPIDLTNDRDYQIPDRARSGNADHATAHQVRPHVERSYRQPVYGQAAYPQMRTRYTQAPATPPKPIHGAPSRVQPVAAFGAPSPQRYFVPRNRNYRIPDK